MAFYAVLDDPDADFLTEEKLLSIIRECKDSDCWSLMIRTVGSIFNNPASLLKSFRVSNPVVDIPSAECSSTKEQLNSMQVDLDKDVDDADPDIEGATAAAAQEVTPPSVVDDDAITLDIDAVRRTFAIMFADDDAPFQSALTNALMYLSRDLDMKLKYHKPLERDPNYLNIFMIVLEIPTLFSPEYIDTATPAFCKVMGLLPVNTQAKLARLWSTFPVEWLKDRLHGLQQLITVKCITTEWDRDFVLVNDEPAIVGAAKTIKLIYCASILGGEWDSSSIITFEEKQQKELDDHLAELYARAQEPGQSKERTPPRQDELMTQLNIKALNCRKPLIGWDDFVNEPLSDVIEMDKDYTNYKMERPDKFTFMTHPFILTTAAKNMGLFYDNRIRMLEERRSSFFQRILGGATVSMPYLKLRIRRDHIIDDALVNVAIACCSSIT